MGNKTLMACCLGATLALSLRLVVNAEDRAQRVEARPRTREPQKAAEKQTEQTLSELAEEAYVYGYPLVMMDQTAKLDTNVASPSGHRAPVNQFARMDLLPDAKFNAVVLPNVDTLYTSAFLDLSAEPVVLHVPDTQGRYYLMPMLDAYSNVFASPGKRTTGTGELTVAIVGPTFKGELPAGVSKIRAPTNSVWIIGRTQINGKDDLSKTVELTNKYSLTPLSSWGKAYTAPTNAKVDPKLDTKTPPAKVLAKLSDRAYFERLAALLEKYPPPEQDKEVLERFLKLGLAPGQFTPSPAASKAIQGTGVRATKQMQRKVAEIGKEANGWRIPTTAGTYGRNYEDRAAIAPWALGANLREDAIYPATAKDSEGKALNGKNRYVLHFPKGQEPPARAFWSLTMYNQDGYFVDNPLDRYAIGSRDALRRNADGSLDLLIQHEEPEGELAANWLPAPRGPFQLLLRVYWPNDTMLYGSWTPPAVVRVRR